MADALPRGLSLERAFAEWMKKELGYTSVWLRVPVKGRVADRAYEVDIHGEKYSFFWDRMMRFGFFGLGVAVLAYLLPAEFHPVRRAMEAAVARLDPALVGHALLVVGGAATAVGFLGRKRAMTHAWVECKDTKTNVKRAQIQKLAAAVQDVRENEKAKWRPDVVILVAGSNFDADALNFAGEHGFLTYRRDGTGFEEVD